MVKGNLGDQVTVGRIILKWILGKQVVRMRYGLNSGSMMGFFDDKQSCSINTGMISKSVTNGS
jgi:hypothetical protein